MLNAKPLTITQHARDAIDERELEMDWIEITTRQPSWIHPDPRPGIERRFRAIPEFGGRILRVACLETTHEIRIISVFFDRRAREPK
jgi:uncharacterized DUF497 family protein